MYNIEWKGSPNRNVGRTGHIPVAIVNHISIGTMQSMTSWFNNPKAQASSHFAVSRKGEIVQYVKLEDTAWTQGLPNGYLQYTNAPIVKQRGGNPNRYCVSIEFEGYMDYDKENDKLVSEGYYGELTEAQFHAGVWLHRFIKDEVLRIFNFNIPLNPHHVIGHFQIDPKRKPFCPGEKFPWARLYSLLYTADRSSLQEMEERLSYLQSPTHAIEKAVAVRARAEDLYQKIEGKYKDEALFKLARIHDMMRQENLL